MIGSQGEYGIMIGNFVWFLGCCVMNIIVVIIKILFMLVVKNVQFFFFRMLFDIVMRIVVRYERLRINKNIVKVVLLCVIVLGFFLVLFFWMLFFLSFD